MASFDLNIKNYSIGDLEKILGLTTSYSKVHIEQNTERMRENIISDDSIGELIKKDTLLFLSKVKASLITNIVGGDSYIINKPRTGYVGSFPSEFYEGDLNPLSKRTIVQNINIDTRFRDNYVTSSAGNFHFDLPMTFSNVLSMQLTAFEPPSSGFFNITREHENNFLFISLNTGITKPYILADGLYTETSIIDALNVLGLTDGIVFSLDINSKKCTIKNILGDSFNVNFAGDSLGTPLPLKLGWMLGFRVEMYTNETIYVSESSIDIVNPRYMYLVIDDFNNNVSNGFFSAFNSSILNKNILARISVKNVLAGNLNMVSTRREYFGPVDIKKMRVQLLDEYGRIIYTHRLDYSFCISFNIVYDL